MNRLSVTWNLVDETNEHSMERYCPNCGRKVLFTDSHIKRHNANGKKIFQYAIYKCPKGHTWNKKLNQYKAKTESFDHDYVDVDSKAAGAGIQEKNKDMLIYNGSDESFSLRASLENGIVEANIFIEQVVGDWRLDKTLADRIDDVSRTQLNQLIKEGRILVNQQRVKPHRIIREQDQIQIVLTVK